MPTFRRPLSLGLASTFLLFFSQIAIAQTVTPITPNPADPSAPLIVFAGENFNIRATVSGFGASSLVEQVDCDGDGNWDINIGRPYATNLAYPVSNDAIEHTCAASPDLVGKEMSAAIEVGVWNGIGVTQQVYALVPIVVVEKTSRLSITGVVQKRLWQLRNTAQLATVDGTKLAFWSDGANVSALNVLAFETAGYRPALGSSNDAYRVLLQQALRGLLNNLTVVAIGSQRWGNPDSNGNGYGIVANSPGPFIDALVMTGTPDAIAEVGPAPSGSNPGILGRKYRDIVQDMVDGLAYCQYDDPTADNHVGGAWGSVCSSPPENLSAGWPAMSLLIAERDWGITVPQWVKVQSQRWIVYSQNTGGWFGDMSNSDTYGMSPTVFTTPAMPQLQFSGYVRSQQPWDLTECYLNSTWTGSSVPIFDSYYSMYFFSRSMLQSDPPLQTLNCSGNNIDWFYADKSTGATVDGVAKRLLSLDAQDYLAPLLQDVGLSWFGQRPLGFALTTLAGLGPAAIQITEPTAQTLKYGTPLQVSAQVTGVSTRAVPTGTVKFMLRGSGSSLTQTSVVDTNGVTTASFADLPAGQYSLTGIYESDNGFLPASAYRTSISVEDSAPPTINVNPPNPMTLPKGGAFVDPGATATDFTGANLAVTTTTTVDTSQPGVYTVTYAAVDKNGKRSSAERQVEVIVGPVLEVPADMTVEILSPAGTVVFYAVKATDKNGSVPFECNPVPGATFPRGENLVDCFAYDGEGNRSSKRFKVTVVDTTPPIINPSAPSSVSADYLPYWTIPFRQAWDAGDGWVAQTASTEIPIASMRLNGSYLITYAASDSLGHTATGQSTLAVVECAPPLITVIGANRITLSVGESWADPGATAVDEWGHPAAVTTEVLGTVDTSIPGGFSYRYTASRSCAGYPVVQSQALRTVDVIRPAKIVVNGPNPLFQEAGVPFSDPGATATDGQGAPVAITSNGVVNVRELSSYTLTYVSRISTGELLTATRTVVVRDTLPPAITLVGNNSIILDPGQSFVDPGATALDAFAGAMQLTIEGSVDSHTPGRYTLIYSAKDPSGNTGMATRSVTVRATPAITWPEPTAIMFGAALSAVQLNATASTPGVFVYTPNTGAVLGAGTQTLSVTFTPTDTAGYTNATATRSVIVNPATSSITLNCPASVGYSGSPQTPCTATATGAGGLSVPVAVTYTNNNALGTATASATFAGDANHTGSNASTTFLITGTGPKTPTPTIAPGFGAFSIPTQVKLTDSLATASIYYTTDGSKPQAIPAELYTGPFTITSTTTVQAMAVATGYTPSNVNSATLTFVVPTPSITPGFGSFSSPTSVTLKDSMLDAVIYYTTDGSTPQTIPSQLYNGPFTIAGTTTIKAIAVEAGWSQSPTNTVTLTFVTPPPSISPGFGTFSKSTPQTITMKDGMDATIRYTLNGSTPTVNSSLYTGPFTISATTTIKAMAIAKVGGYNQSAVNSVTLTFK